MNLAILVMSFETKQLVWYYVQRFARQINTVPHFHRPCREESEISLCLVGFIKVCSIIFNKTLLGICRVKTVDAKQHRAKQTKSTISYIQWLSMYSRLR